ncbi:hypothetical protein [Nesterenkonia ebinurensis]|uniref:hypothetical protein n=1 Tax=Nesterenkonia ebinurensis TaxID=2608252 RepID=UPI00123C9796|nr:hypothetical protein [Nesterenkonia ebinurensis]
MPVIRIEFETTPEKAKKFHKRVMAGAPFTGEEEQAINEAWDRGRTPTGVVHYRGISNDQPPALKFDVEVSLELTH